MAQCSASLCIRPVAAAAELAQLRWCVRVLQQGIQELGELCQAARARHIDSEAWRFHWVRASLEYLRAQVDRLRPNQDPTAHVMRALPS